jgi:hypothetical protein
MAPVAPAAKLLVVFDRHVGCTGFPATQVWFPANRGGTSPGVLATDAIR